MRDELETIRAGLIRAIWHSLDLGEFWIPGGVGMYLPYTAVPLTEVQLGIEVLRFVGADLAEFSWWLEVGGVKLVEGCPTVETEGLPCNPNQRTIDHSAFWRMKDGRLDGRCVIDPSGVPC